MHVKLQQAIEYRTQEKFDEAHALFNELLADAPTDAVIRYHYAWLHDKQGDERGAVPHYEQAIALGLPAAEQQGALLGLGSTYRTLGEYEKAAATLERGKREFPECAEFDVFLAMAYYNLGRHTAAMELLLKTIVATAQHPTLERFKRAIDFYADKLDQTW
jgi:tetratricopeptide (TPR) repeat protein